MDSAARCQKGDEWNVREELPGQPIPETAKEEWKDGMRDFFTPKDQDVSKPRYVVSLKRCNG